MLYSVHVSWKGREGTFGLKITLVPNVFKTLWVLEFLLVSSKLDMLILLTNNFTIQKGINLVIIIGDVYKFNVHYLIPDMYLDDAKMLSVLATKPFWQLQILA